MPEGQNKKNGERRWERMDSGSGAPWREVQFVAAAVFLVSSSLLLLLFIVPFLRAFMKSS